MENFFTSSRKFFSFIRSSNYYPNFFGHVGKRLDKKAKFNFKTY